MSNISQKIWQTLERTFSQRDLNFEEARKRIFSGAFSLIIAIVLLAFVPLHIRDGLMVVAVCSVIAAAALLASLMMARAKAKAGNLYLVPPVVCGVILLGFALNGDSNRFAVFWTFTYFPMVFFLLGIRSGIICSTVVGACWIYLLLNPLDAVTSEFFTPEFAWRLGMSMLVFIGICAYFEWVRGLSVRNVNYEHQVLVEDRKQMHRLAYSDELTQLPNRRSAVHFLDDTIAALSYDVTRIALVAILDIDRFKVINDQFGHQVGDRVLVEVAQRIQLAIRADDFVGRYGGEEFLIVVPSAAEERYQDILEKIRWAICQRPIEVDDVLHHVTASIGASSTSRELSHEDVIERADQALYTAKQSGRNRTMLYHENLEHAHVATIAS